MGEVLRLEGVWKAFDRGRERVSVLEDVSLSVSAGEVVAVVGTRYQGKTTLIRVASGTLPIDRGRVCVGGLELTGLKDRKLARVLARDIGVATRTGDPALRVHDYVWLSLAAARELRWRERRLRVAAVLKEMELDGCADLKWSELSSWQRVLLEFAQAIVVRPRLLLVDDVVDGLGLGKKQAAMELLKGFADDLECGVLMAVSDHAAALRSLRVWGLNAGKLKLMADHTNTNIIPIREQSDDSPRLSAG